MSHTILLLQVNTSLLTRRYYDYRSVSAAIDGLCVLFEAELRAQTKPRAGAPLSYGVEDLFAFIDTLGDISMLVFSKQISAYEPKGKEWIKERTVARLKQIAGAK